MRVWSWHNVSWPAKAIIVSVIGFLVIAAALGIQSGIFAITIIALILMAVFVCSAPFVFSGRWRKPEPVATRRPVYKKRRV